MVSVSGTHAVRSVGLGSSWSRLYQSSHCFLDLALQRNPLEAILMGQIVPKSPEHEVVGSVATPAQRFIPLDAQDSFWVVLEPGLYDLHIHLGSGLIVVRGLEA